MVKKQNGSASSIREKSPKRKGVIENGSMSSAREKSPRKRRNNEEKYSMETHLIYGRSFTPKWEYSHHVVPPISASATFRLESAQRGALGFLQFAHTVNNEEVEVKAPIYIYDRLGEPNKEMLEEYLAYAEQGESAVTFASGMGAISAVLGILTRTGDEVIAHKLLYGCTYELLTYWYPRYQISTKFIDLRDLSNLKKAITPKTRVVYFETPVNPTLELIDIAGVAEIVKEENKKRKPNEKIYIVVDNTFATPFCQRPLTLGADFVVHSLTKNIGGFGTDMGGVVIGPKWSRDRLLLYRKDFGGVLGTKSAWAILVYGLPTLALRVRQQEKTAMEVARFLCSHPKVQYVSYPGLHTFPQYELAKKQMVDYEGNFAPGTLIYFVIKDESPEGRRKKAEKLINYLAKNAYTITLAVSLGNVRTLIEHPGSMTHATIPAEEQLKKGIDPGGIRLSIGLEKVDDIILDLSEGLAKI
ncbi:trans-sulfuration enzyme family protein [Candidatus Kryptobacter tengchongensis]|nr:aminotransferase class I/II-fold pyridoxal phosphate-dependent enzyme [Candidatus Kryptobacter tengchongensis]